MKKIANPILSIITINYNNKQGLIQTIESVVNQTWKDFEYLVVDGGSTDGSKDVITQHINDLTYWVSEPDKGIYNAMNKGIEMATGDYLLFLNSGDYLKDSSVLGKTIPQLDNIDIVYTDLEIITDKGHHVQNYPDRLSFKHFFYSSLPHPASFIKKVLFVKYGVYDENLKICADWQFFIEAICKHNVTYKHLDLVLACHFANGISSIEESKPIITKERNECLLSNFPAFMPDYNEFDRWNKQRIVKWLKKVHLLR